MTPVLFGPTAVGQLERPPVPDTNQFTTPDGASAPEVPVTVAVIVTEPPRTSAADAESATVGVGAETNVVDEDATGKTAL